MAKIEQHGQKFAISLGGNTPLLERLGGDASPHRSAGEGSGWDGGASRPGEPGWEGREKKARGGRKKFPHNGKQFRGFFHTMETCFRNFSIQWKRVSGTFPHNGSIFRAGFP